MEELIESTLTQCAKDGFTASAIEAALNTTEFHLRENNTGRFPRGLSLMLRAMGNWIYDKDPYEALQWTEPLNAFKVRQSTLQNAQGCLVVWHPLHTCSDSSVHQAAIACRLCSFRCRDRCGLDRAQQLTSMPSESVSSFGDAACMSCAQARMASGEDVFGPLIQRYLLKNTHKVTVELLPDAKLGAKVEQDEKARLKVLPLAVTLSSSLRRQMLHYVPPCQRCCRVHAGGEGVAEL